MAGDDAVRLRCCCQRLLNKAVEELAPAPRFSSIEPKRKFVEVVWQVPMADRALMRSQQPAFQ